MAAYLDVEFSVVVRDFSEFTTQATAITGDTTPHPGGHVAATLGECLIRTRKRTRPGGTLTQVEPGGKVGVAGFEPATT